MSAPITLPQIAIKRPLVTISTAVEALDRSSYEVMALIECGRLSFAWNIASRESCQREVRILTQSLVAFQSGQPAPTLAEEEDFQRAVKLILPAVSHSPDGVATVCAATITKRFSTTSQHILHLVRERSLRLVKNTVCRRGPGGSPEIEFASVINFLKLRRIH